MAEDHSLSKVYQLFEPRSGMRWLQSLCARSPRFAFAALDTLLSHLYDALLFALARADDHSHFCKFCRPSLRHTSNRADGAIA
jgi:hypothetical protein